MANAVKPEVLHHRVFIGSRAICKECHVRWPCLIAQEHIAAAKLIADPWWYVGLKPPVRRGPAA